MIIWLSGNTLPRPNNKGAETGVRVELEERTPETFDLVASGTLTGHRGEFQITFCPPALEGPMPAQAEARGCGRDTNARSLTFKSPGFFLPCYMSFLSPLSQTADTAAVTSSLRKRNASFDVPSVF